MNKDFQTSLWEDFTGALMSNKVADAELMLEEVNDHKSEAGWADVVLKMYDEWYLWLEGKSEFNHHENKELIHG